MDMGMLKQSLHSLRTSDPGSGVCPNQNRRGHGSNFDLDLSLNYSLANYDVQKNGNSPPNMNFIPTPLNNNGLLSIVINILILFKEK